MKKLEIITKPFHLDEIKDALEECGIRNIMITDIRDVDTGDNEDPYEGADYIIDFVPRTKIEIIVESDKVKKIIETIKNVAKNSEVDSGKIFIFPIEEIIEL